MKKKIKNIIERAERMTEKPAHARGIAWIVAKRVFSLTDEGLARAIGRNRSVITTERNEVLRIGYDEEIRIVEELTREDIYIILPIESFGNST